MYRQFFVVAVALPIMLAGQSAEARQSRYAAMARGAHKSGMTKMTQSSILSCELKSAIINLVDEDLLTRTTITMDTIDGFAKPMTITAGDPRLSKLNDLLHGLTLRAPTLPQLEMRMLMRLTCTDGTTRIVTGSKTDSDGVMHLNVDGKMAMTDAPLRRALEAIMR